MSRLAIAALLVSHALIPQSQAAANTLATWTNGAGNNAWETPANWDINQVPNSSIYDVRIATAAPCNLSSQFQIGSLLLSTNTATLNLAPPALLAISSANGANYSGNILVNTTAANLATTLRFDTSTSLNGSGTIQLNGINPGDAMLTAASGVTVSNEANHTIRGRGDISFASTQAILVNNGTILGDGPNNNFLRLSLGNAPANKNNGTIQSTSTNDLPQPTSSGTIVIEQGFLDQSGGGTIINATLGASGHMPTIMGGFVKGATVTNAFFDGVTLQGVTVPPGGLLSVLSKGLTNNGNLILSTFNSHTPAILRFDASAVVDGAGLIVLDLRSDPVAQPVISADGVTVTIGPTQSIVGSGEILMTGNNTALIVNGQVTASGKMRVFLSDSPANKNNRTFQNDSTQQVANLFLEQGTLDQSAGGYLSFANLTRYGIIQIGGAGTFTVIGGSIGNVITCCNLPLYHVVQGVAAVLAGDISLVSKFEIPPNAFTLVTASKLTNNNVMTLDANTSLLRFDASTSIAGTGTVVLTNNAILEVNNNAPNNVIHGSGHTITGNGTIRIDPGSTLINNGLIAPGTSVGTLNFDGNLRPTFASNLAFEIGGTNQGIDYDLLHKVDNGTFTLNGKLSVTLTNGFTPISSDVFTIITTQSMLAGAFTNVRSGARLNTSDGRGSFVVTYSGNNVVLSNFGPPIASSQLLNIASRLRVLTDDNALIGGFIVTGSDAKKVLLRGIGPSLTNQGVPGALPNPTLELHSSNGSVLAFNDDWKDSQRTEIEATGIQPSNDLESAIIAPLPANNSSYTVVLRDKNGMTGVGLVEVYDLNTAASSKLANISTRGFVGTDDNVMIGGVIIGASAANGTNVLLRAIGPSLTGSGITNALVDPTLELHDPNGVLLAFDDNWKDSQQESIQGTGIPPSNNAESAILATLAPGNYTAVVRGANNGTGIAVVEVYNLP